MRRINRSSYFKYLPTDGEPYKIRAFNEDNKRISIQIQETGAEQSPVYKIEIKTKSPRPRETANSPFYVKRAGARTECDFDISDYDDKDHTCSVFAITEITPDIIAEWSEVDVTNELEVVSTEDSTNAVWKKITEIDFSCGSDNNITTVRMERAGVEETDDIEFWQAIKRHQLNFKEYLNFINKAMYDPNEPFNPADPNIPAKYWPPSVRRSHVFVGVNEYMMLKQGTEFFMLRHSALQEAEVSQYMSDRLPYFEHLSDTYDSAELEYLPAGTVSESIKKTRFKTPFFIELIWNYWMEQGMLMQSMNLINLRFQNINVGNGANNQLARFDLSPLRPLSHLLWGFIQDEQHRLSLPRRTQEYDHEYGLLLAGRTVPAFTPADSRSKFLEAFHNLLTTTSIYYKEADDTTRIADAFPVLNCLKEVHLLLAEGNHNAYGNLTWTARHEMLMTQYLIARDEMRVFLGGRPMVPYPEEWMDRVDTVRSMMGWGSTSITYYYDLAVHGEKLLLSIRYGDWSNAYMPAVNAANWALAFRDSVQKYMHGYRTVTGADLSADAPGNNSPMRSLQPSMLIQRRMLEERSRTQRRA